MAQSVQRASQDIVTFEIRVDGATIPGDLLIPTIEIEWALNRIPRATIKIVDGHQSTSDFPVSASDQFKPGRRIEIKLGYNSENRTVFSGIILRHGLEVRRGGNAYLKVTCADEAIRMTGILSSAQFSEKTDSEVIGELIRNAGLSADVDTTTVRHEYAIKQQATDWDYILARAYANGLVVNVEGGSVAVKEPSFSSPKLEASFGESLESLHLEIDPVAQVPAVETKAWQATDQSVIDAKSKEPSVNDQGNLSGRDLVDVLGLETPSVPTLATINGEGLQAWADAKLLWARMSRIRGQVRLPGNAGLRPGETLALEGLGDRFNGEAYMSGVRHLVSAGEWLAEIELGLPSEPISMPERPLSAPAASGQRPGIRGLQIAKVKQIHDDPKGDFRIKVFLPLLDFEEDGFWVRKVHPYATENAGWTFLPEVGDEVVLAFLDDDPDSALLLGSLHSGARPQPVAPADGNFEKLLLTKGELRIAFNDEHKTIDLATPGGQTAHWGDKDEMILIQDSHGNKVELASSGITLDSPGDVTIKAAGKVTIEGSQGVEVSSPQDVKISGLNTDIAASASLSAKGGGSAELSASGQTTVKGSLVMIN
ncbi:MAG: type VI secretion system tip protein VgrG [Paracoccaceae bacterium]|nr:type VI secretion system tip protein VgrG [Paracoccaceae bacterium]